MKVLVDISSLGLGVLHPDWRGGGFRADERLLEELAASGECDLTFCANHASVTWDAAQQYLRANARLSGFPLLEPESGGQPLLRGLLGTGYRFVRKLYPHGPLPRIVRGGGELIDRHSHRAVTDTPSGADIFHSTHFPLPPPARKPGPQRFLTIYDLRYRLFPHLYDERSITVGEAILSSVQADDWVITGSDSSRNHLVDTGAVTAHQVFVVPLAADPERFYRCGPDAVARVREKYRLGSDPYVLSVSSADIRKNLHQAVHAFAALARQKRLGSARLVLAGGPGSGSSLLAKARAEAADVGDRIVHIGFVAETDLAALYSGATTFLYPSLYEGFGLPPLEAMQCGTAVITSNASSLPEVVGNAGVMVPPDDVEALANAIYEVMSNVPLREALSERALRRAREFSWKRTASTLLNAYRTALGAR